MSSGTYTRLNGRSVGGVWGTRPHLQEGCQRAKVTLMQSVCRTKVTSGLVRDTQGATMDMCAFYQVSGWHGARMPRLSHFLPPFPAAARPTNLPYQNVPLGQIA